MYHGRGSWPPRFHISELAGVSVSTDTESVREKYDVPLCTPCLRLVEVYALSLVALPHIIQKEDASSFGAVQMDVDTFLFADKSFSNAPYMNFNRDTGKVKLNANDVANRNSNYGSGVLGERT